MINGSRSTYPVTLDDWGQEKTNDSCTFVDAEYFNTLQDATYNLERYTQRVLLVGNASLTTPATSGRANTLYKTFVVTATGTASEVKTLQGPTFSTSEKAAFDGTPLASGICKVFQVRKILVDESKGYGVVASLRGPISDPSGDSGWFIQLSTLIDDRGTGAVKVYAGTYIVTAMFVRG